MPAGKAAGKNSHVCASCSVMQCPGAPHTAAIWPAWIATSSTSPSQHGPAADLPARSNTRRVSPRILYPDLPAAGGFGSLAMEQDQFFGGPFALRELNPHTGLRSYMLTDKKLSESQGVSNKRGYCTGGEEWGSRAAREQPDDPSCSQRPHDKTVVARCAQ